MSSRRTIVICDYDPAWPARFAALRDVYARSLGRLALAIEHVGSTSVPDLPAKPILDIDVVIDTLAQLGAAVEALHALGYSHQGERGIPQRHAFDRADATVPRDGSGRTWCDHHLYVCPRDSPELERHLAFRDYLRADPDRARAYASLKRALAKAHPHDGDAYCEAKTGFIEESLRLADRRRATS